MTQKSFATTRDNSTNPAFKHLNDFHTRPQWRHEPALTSSHTIFHGDTPELPEYVPKYMVTPATAALASRHGSSPYSFRATAEKAGLSPDGRPAYRFAGQPEAASTVGLGTGRLTSNTLGSTGLPPVQYKNKLTEYRDEYREPREALDTQRSLTQRFGTSGYRATQRTTRSDGLPKYESRVVAF